MKSNTHFQGFFFFIDFKIYKFNHKIYKFPRFALSNGILEGAEKEEEGEEGGAETIKKKLSRYLWGMPFFCWLKQSLLIYQIGDN